MKKLALAGLALLLVLALSAPLITGTLTKSSWDDMSRELNRGGAGFANLETLEYNQGYSGAEVLSKLVLMSPELEAPVVVYLRSAIDHGITGAHIETRLDPEHHQPVLDLFGEDKPVLVSDAAIGSFESSLSIPAVEETEREGGSFGWSALAAAVALTDDGDRARVSLTWPGFRVAQGQDRLQVSNVSLDEDMSRLLGEVWSGTIDVTIDEISGQLPESGAFAARNLTLAATTRESGEGRLENRMNLAVAALETGGEPYGDVRMEFVAEGFDIEATNEVLLAANRLNQEVADPEADPVEQAVAQIELFSGLMGAVRSLMAEGLSVSIPTMVLNTPDGTAELDFSFSHPELEVDQSQVMASIFQHSTGGLNLKVPAALTQHLPMNIQGQLYQLHQQGLLLEKDGVLLLNVALDGMALNINGQPIPIPPLI